MLKSGLKVFMWSAKKFPKIKIVTSEIDNGLDEEDFVLFLGMGGFGDRYFGTDED